MYHSCVQKSIISLFILVITATTMPCPQSSFYAANHKESRPQVPSHFGGDDRNIELVLENYPSTASVAPPATITDSLHKPDIVSRVGTSSRERQKFWFLNFIYIYIGSKCRQNVS
jgi:hypothetical protein